MVGSGWTDNGTGVCTNVVSMPSWGYMRLTTHSGDSRNGHGRATTPGMEGGMVGPVVAGVVPLLVGSIPIAACVVAVGPLA